MEHETWLTAFGIHLFCQSFVKLTIVCLITGVLHMNVFHFAKFEIKLIDTIQCIVCSGAPPRSNSINSISANNLSGDGNGLDERYGC